VVTGPAYDATTREVSRVVLCVAPTVDPPPQLLEDVRLWGRQFHVPIKVLMVTDRPSAIAFDFELIRAQVRRMEPVAESLATEGQEVDLAHLQGGGAVHEIVTYADAQPGTVLAMATHARPPASRFFLGSGAIGVLRRTKCPVLLRRYPTDA
jgi:nucleotide-binding universal stress UspA family protein